MPHPTPNPKCPNPPPDRVGGVWGDIGGYGIGCASCPSTPISELFSHRNPVCKQGKHSTDDDILEGEDMKLQRKRRFSTSQVNDTSQLALMQTRAISNSISSLTGSAATLFEPARFWRISE